MASTPVRAEQPAAKAFRIRIRPSASVDCAQVVADGGHGGVSEQSDDDRGEDGRDEQQGGRHQCFCGFGDPDQVQAGQQQQTDKTQGEQMVSK